MSDEKYYIYPEKVNTLILLVSIATYFLLLFVFSNFDKIELKILSSLLVAFPLLTIFSLLHETVHESFCRNTKLNKVIGRGLALFFPSSFTAQKNFHLTHHEYNRSPWEQFDFIREDDNKILKALQWYSILTGLYWLVMVFSLFILFFIPKSLVTLILERNEKTRFETQTGFYKYLRSLYLTDFTIIKIELLITILFHVTICLIFNINFLEWLFFYAPFAFIWSNIQYADHAFSPLSKNDGAWNLKTSAVFSKVILNYNYHLNHHRFPKAPWTNLKDIDDKLGPSIFTVILEMWKGPKNINESKQTIF